jgi:hypothetical protein
MIIIGLVLLILGLLVSILAFRGRIVARGQFCRRCQFDLAGLDLESSATKCPECGREIHQEPSRRALLRRRSRVGLVVATIMLLGGGGGIWAGATGKTGSIITAMPDPIVLWLTDLGVDEALDELVVRVSKVPSTMSAGSWDEAIEQGLAFQADTALVWDVRWGEVLFDALNLNQMSDGQVEQYFSAGFTHQLVVRDRVHPGTNNLPNKLKRIQTRLGPIWGSTTEFVMRSQITRVGVVGHEPIYTGELSEYRRQLRIDNDGPTTSSSGGTYGFKEYFSKLPGERVDIQFEYTVRLDYKDYLEPIFEKHFQETVSVSIIDPSEPIVRVVKNDAVAKGVFESIFMSPIRLEPEFSEDEQRNPRVMTNAAVLIPGGVDMPVSLQLFLQLDGQEYKVGKLTTSGRTGGGVGGMIILRSFNGRDRGIEVAREIHEKLVGQDLASIVARVDPGSMARKPSVDEILGITIVFEQVPVKVVEKLGSFPGIDLSDPTNIKPTSYKSFGDQP